MKCASITLLILGDLVWLARRPVTKTIMPDLLECAGGSADGYELRRDTAVREVAEEAGLQLAPDRFEFRGVIFVDGWQYSLFFIELTEDERPKNVEPTKRSEWYLCCPDGVTMKWCSPALGALLSIFVHELRMRRSVA